VTGAASLVFPDYAGNTMFQTLGNIAANRQAGLLFVDWERGSTLQLSGAARVIWDPAEAAQRSGAERAVEVQIHQVIERGDASSLRPRG
jgi:predicted pyridoxine 5'-phosphate oxidase superfamily flavin-nucleotide-binding protein